MCQCDYEEAERRLLDSVALFRTLDETRGLAYAQTSLALLAVARGQYADAGCLLVECVAVARARNDPSLLAVNLGHLAIVVHAQGDSEKAASYFEEALTVARIIPNGFLTSSVLTYKGRAEFSDGNLELAEATLAESLTIVGDLKEPVITVWGWNAAPNWPFQSETRSGRQPSGEARRACVKTSAFQYRLTKRQSIGAWSQLRASHWARTPSTKPGAKVAR
jgi:tetratricopeptide (TPR) repeat protein